MLLKKIAQLLPRGGFVILFSMVLYLFLGPNHAWAINSPEEAVVWAKTQIGSPAYHLQCLKFVRKAYQITSTPWGYATAAATALVSHTDRNPVPGALVFYHWTGTVNGVKKDWGHVGISLGNGRVISALAKVQETGLDIKGCKYWGWGFFTSTSKLRSAKSDHTFLIHR